MHRRLAWLAVSGWLLGAGLAMAQVPLCLEIEAPAEQRAGLERLVRAELGHHPSHRLVTRGCRTRLIVELFRIGTQWYLTARLDQQIPVRHRFEKLGELDRLLRDALAQVLEHDPMFLSEDITRYSFLQRAAHSVLKRGHNFWRLELFQSLGRGGEAPALAAGGAVSLSRGADNWLVFVRAFAAGWPGRPSGKGLVLQVLAGAEGGVSYEFSRLGWASPYLAAGLGLEYRRYRGLLDPASPESGDYRNDFGPVFTVRLGVRLLRYYSFDCDVFAMVRLPLYPADRDSLLDDFYPVDGQFGLGVGF